MQFDSALSSEPVNGKIELHADYYKEYKRVYDSVLEKVENDFT